MKKYDYLIVGCGPFGAVFAQQATAKGKRCLIIEKRDHIGGNLYCEDVNGIHVHKYGAHIFHTNSRDIWDYVNRFAEFNRYTNSPIANYKGEIYNMPFNMNTFNKMWGVVTPEQARAKIAEQQAAVEGEPRNLEEQAIRLVGSDIYTKLVKGYTEKQWGRDCTQLPAFIIKRLPVRYTYDNNYFNDRYQGIPIGGYNVLIEGLIAGVEVRLGVDYDSDREAFNAMADKVVYTGMLDAFYQYRFGKLEYRSLRLRVKSWTWKTIRAWRLSTTPTARHPSPALSSISISNSAPSPLPSSPGSIPKPGKREWSPIIPSTTRPTRRCISNMRS